jgi:hypothetical protein
MQNVIKSTRTLLLALGLAALGPVVPVAARAETAAAENAAAKPDTKKLTQHLKEHQAYPATRAQLLAACNDLVDFSAGEKRWYADHLPEGTYKSAAEVLKAIGRK